MIKLVRESNEYDYRNNGIPFEQKQELRKQGYEMDASAVMMSVPEGSIVELLDVVTGEKANYEKIGYKWERINGYVGGNKTVDEIMQDSFKVTNVKFVPKSKTELDVTYSGENIGEIYRPEGSNEFEVDLNFKGKKYSGTTKNAAEAKKLAKSAFMELVKRIKF